MLACRPFVGVQVPPMHCKSSLLLHRACESVPKHFGSILPFCRLHCCTLHASKSGDEQQKQQQRRKSVPNRPRGETDTGEVRDRRDAWLRLLRPQSIRKRGPTDDALLLAAERARIQCWFRMHASWRRLPADCRAALARLLHFRALGSARCTSFCAEAAQQIGMPAKPARRHAISTALLRKFQRRDARCTAGAEAVDASRHGWDASSCTSAHAPRLRRRGQTNADQRRSTQINACFSCFPSPRQCQNATLQPADAKFVDQSPSLPLPYVSQKASTGAEAAL